MDKAEEKQDKHSRKAEPRCDPKQLALLKQCVKKGDTTKWNNWRVENIDDDEIWLEGADLYSTHLKGADFAFVHLKGAKLAWANFEGGRFTAANLEDTNFTRARLGGVDLTRAQLEGAIFEDTHLEGADLRKSIVDGSTLFWNCTVDRKTDFRGVGLEDCRMDEKTKHFLQYNRRRMNCEGWYKEHPRLAWLAKAFFWTSDYGHSTGRIIFTFFGLALIFAGIYYICALVNSPGIVSNLLEGNEGPVPSWLVPFRTIYFSIVTMTTLGFGDMHANCQSFWGHFLLTVQVILGYVLLAALVTRIGVLFTSGVIPGQFKKSGKKPESDE